MTPRGFAGACLLTLAAPVAGQEAIAPFSSASPGEALPPGWRAVSLARIRPAEIRLVQDEGRTVLRVRSEQGFGSAAFATRIDAPLLAWRWKVDHALEHAALGTKDGDDFAARVYVTFEIPADQLSLGERLRLRLARLIHGDVPSAAICYVWAGGDSKGRSLWSPYAERVRLVVLRSGNAEAGRWVEERRDVAADFREAFGRAPVPVTGIAAGNDSDQTGASATAWFGDFRVESR